LRAVTLDVWDSFVPRIPMQKPGCGSAKHPLRQLAPKETRFLATPNDAGVPHVSVDELARSARWQNWPEFVRHLTVIVSRWQDFNIDLNSFIAPPGHIDGVNLDRAFRCEPLKPVTTNLQRRSAIRTDGLGIFQPG